MEVRRSQRGISTKLTELDQNYLTVIENLTDMLACLPSTKNAGRLIHQATLKKKRASRGSKLQRSK
jgi:hypothetical protein